MDAGACRRSPSPVHDADLVVGEGDSRDPRMQFAERLTERRIEGIDRSIPLGGGLDFLVAVEVT